MTRSKSWLPSYIALGTSWGLSFYFIEQALLSLSSFGVAFFRILIGALTLILWGSLTGNYFITDKKLWKHFIVVGMFLNAFPFLMFAIGQQYISSSMAGILNATTPLFSYLFLVFIFRSEKVNLSQSVGIPIGFLGVIVLLGLTSETDASSKTGVFLILLATIGYGFAFPYAKKFLSVSTYSATSLAISQLVFAATLLIPLLPLLDLTKGTLQQSSILSIFALGALGTGFAYIWNFKVIDLAGSTVASTVTYLTPLFASMVGFFALNEEIKFNQIFGGILILVSSALVQKRIKLPGRRKGV